MTGDAKRKTLILFGLVLIITMIIAASLPRLEFKAGMPLPELENNQVVAAQAAAEPFLAIPVNEFFSVFFAIILIGSMLYILYKLIKGAKWKNISAFVWRTIFISIIVGGFLLVILKIPDSGNSKSTAMPVPTTAEPLATAPLGQTPPLLLWLVGIGLLGIGILLGVWILTSASRKETPIDLVGFEAEKAWKALKNGLDLKDVITKCYHQMSLALEKKRGIKRKDFMTTGEFENLLVLTGIPHEPVHQLTQLFEAVRYGKWQPNFTDEQRAIKCLETIILSSRDPKGSN
jgi:hypothetical protein